MDIKNVLNKAMDKAKELKKDTSATENNDGNIIVVEEENGGFLNIVVNVVLKVNCTGHYLYLCFFCFIIRQRRAEYSRYQTIFHSDRVYVPYTYAWGPYHRHSSN